jgi:SAM-dependent methyltransferase
MKNPVLNNLIIKDDFSPFENLGSIASFIDDLPSYVDRAAVDSDRFPIPTTKDREHYHGDMHAAWWLSGRTDMLAMRAAAERVGIDFDHMRYYEMGCATGRVVRHLLSGTQADVWCSDINARHVEWIRQYLGPRAKVFNNTALPILPLESSTVDMVAAFSVFTHIDDLEAQWLLELRRILRPGGLAYVTVCTEDTWEQYKADWIKQTLMPLADQIRDYRIDNALFSGPLPNDKTVFWWPSREVYNSSVFHSKKYIKDLYGRFFEIVEIVRNGHTYQDVLLLRK